MNGNEAEIEVADDIQLEKRTSYLDIIRGKIQKENKTAMTYRVVIIGQFSKDIDRVDYSSYYQKFFKKEQSEMDIITGILLSFKSCFIHMLEAPKKIVYSYLMNIASNPKSELKKDNVPFVCSSRLLVLQDDIQERFFPFWASKIVESDGSAYSDFSQMEESSLDELVRGRLIKIASTCINIYKIGKAIGQLSRNEMKQAFEEIVDRYHQFIPSSQMISELSTFRGLISVEEWVKTFHQEEMDLTLESGILSLTIELVWPAEKPLVI
ncbi:hypothetical protein HDV06_002272 [Boothiomyces sp. JEL0866]|nr:hypothetical protein HDV06_002272 [Boothiomyces sp. JEL0866]